MTTKVVQDSNQSTAAHQLTDDYPFKKMTWPKFNVVAVANELLRQNSSYRGKQDVLFEGFCTWMLVPGIPDLRLYTMQLSARKAMDEALDVLIQKKGKSSSTPQTCWKKKDIRIFKKRVYDPLGGHTGVYEAISSIDLANIIEKHALGGEVIIRLAAIWHYVVETDLVAEGEEISIVQSKQLPIPVGVMDDGGKLIKYSERHVERFLQILKTSIAFSYAASTISIPNKGTILDQIRDHEVPLESARHFFPQWFARAKYFDQVVLSRLAKPKRKLKTRPPTPASRISFGRFPSLAKIDVDAESIPTPHFDKRQKEEIETVFPRPSAGSRSKAR